VGLVDLLEPLRGPRALARRLHIGMVYWLLAGHAEVRERRAQLRHPVYAAPELLACRPNELWSWDITKLLGPAKWTYFYLYVMLDVFSRYVVGWMVAHRESATLAEQFIHETCARQGIERDQLTTHADRGPAMTSKPVAFSAQSLAGLAGRSAVSACPAGRLGLACRRSLRRGRQGQTDESPGKAPEG
jgi:transposase InsO family protein